MKLFHQNTLRDTSSNLDFQTSSLLFVHLGLGPDITHSIATLTSSAARHQDLHVFKSSQQ